MLQQDQVKKYGGNVKMDMNGKPQLQLELEVLNWV